MKERKPNETDAQYIKRLEDANANLRRRNNELAEWASRLNAAVTTLATEGSLVFQLMAEKAGVRSHPSVTDAVRLFDSISHPQWQNDTPPKIEWPTDWDLDDADAQSGDADMSLNAPLAELAEILEALKFEIKFPRAKAIDAALEDIEKALRSRVDVIKTAAGFVPKAVSLPSGHYRDLDADALRELVSAVSWMALDPAQDMHFANHALRRDLRASVYRRVGADLYKLSALAMEPRDKTFDIKVFGNEPAF